MQPATKTLHHYPIGGSRAARILNCPASIEAEASSPKRPSSSHADEGNALHDAMEYILDSDEAREPQDLLGMQFNGYRITQDYIDEAITPALRYFDKMVGEAEYEIEVTATFPDLADAGGTTDVVFFPTPRTLGILDWKFGRGVTVNAEYNAQMMFYACCILTAQNLWDRIRRIEMHICQPRKNHYDSWECGIDDLAAFRDKFISAVNGRKFFQTGAWCRFCAHAPFCAAKRDEARDALLWRETGPALGEAMAIIDELETWASEVRAAVMTALEKGAHVDGWKLVDKRASRLWVDENKARLYLLGHGLTEDQIAPRSLVTPAQAEKLLKLQGDKVQSDMVQKVSSGHTMAREDDPRDSVGPAGHRDLSALAAFL